MLYLGKTAVHSFGQTPVGQSRVSFNAPDRSGSVYVNNACLVARYASQTGKTRNVWMDRLYDWVNYCDIPINSAPPAGGFEVEATFEPVKSTQPAYQAVWGIRSGSSPVKRANLLVGAENNIQQGLSVEPSANSVHNIDIRGKKVHVRMICEPTFSEDYAWTWLSRLIVEDVRAGTTLLDTIDYFGNDEASDAFMSDNTTFYRFHSAWFSRNRYANPSQNAPTGNEFNGYFYGGAVYINPTGADSTIPTRVPVQTLTPVKAGQTYTIKYPGSYYSGEQEITTTGVAVEIIDIETLLSTGEIQSRFFRMMDNCAAFTEAVIEYQDY